MAAVPSAMGRGITSTAPMSVPVAITVEGANILTRSLMIFGQGAIRCHPYLLKEMEAANLPDPNESLVAFDKALFAHVYSAASNVIRSFWHNLTGGFFASCPRPKGIEHVYRGLHVASVTFAAVADLAMGSLGGEMKRRESISARLGDVLSELYLLSCVVKRFETDGSKTEDLPLVEWNFRSAMYEMQNKLDEVLNNLPARPIAWLLRLVAFPLGRRRRPPSDRLARKCAQLILSPGETRDRLTTGIYLNHAPGDATGRMELAFAAAVQRDAIEDKIKKAGHSGRKALSDLASLVKENVITQAEADQLATANAIVRESIDVDDFQPSELTARKTMMPPAEAAE
jgi:acyl-CoA dehydrogenase